ncbi:hypothetical protein MHB48_04495 [Psychrobacillus sp. FSL H8-0483]|uniref:hypothetical protein n=1 Tax=Psychrobacillus sp. FSL H8-0483 TaxID=2921389 RepID=UPI00315B3EE6
MSEVLYEVVESYNEYIKKVPAGCQTISDNLRGNHITFALQQIIDFTDGAKWLSEASDLFHKNSLSVDLRTDKINYFLQEINNGLEIQDYVLVADIFEYEIQPFFLECLNVEVSGLQ